MYRIKTLNKISSAGLDLLDQTRFQVGGEVENEDGVLVRSAPMHDYVFPEELRAIREAGLNRAYLGVESGSDAVLKAINKGVTAAQMLEAGQKLVAAGFDLWAIIIMGLTGQDGDWEEHILSTAGMINEMRPRHLSAMTFAPAKGTPLGEDVLAGRFQVCTPDQILEECRLLIEHLDVDPLHFTSNHASNYLPLKGGLPEDREKFLSLLDEALAGKIRLRKTLNRGI